MNNVDSNTNPVICNAFHVLYDCVQYTCTLFFKSCSIIELVSLNALISIYLPPTYRCVSTEPQEQLGMTFFVATGRSLCLTVAICKIYM